MKDFSAGAKRHRRALAVFCTVLISVLVAVAAAGCGSKETTEGTEDQEQTWQQTELYLGRDIPGGGAVSDEEFQKFLEEVVTREFPRGMTVFDAYGQMQDDGGNIVKQSTKAVLLVHEKGKAADDSIAGVIDAYRERFGSPQVMRTTIPIDVEFFQSGPAS
jgi:hypothetical protein